MSNLRNRVQLIGHLGADPEVKSFDSGKKRAVMNVATSESYKVNNEWKEDTQWHRVVAWGTSAERAEKQLQKGSHVLIEGKLVHRSYEDKQGATKYISEVQVQNFECLDGNRNVNPGTDYAEDPAKSKVNQPR